MSAGPATGWTEQIAAFADCDKVFALLEHPGDPILQTEAERLLHLSHAAGWFTAFADPDFPDFVPMVNTHLNAVGTNPDFVYGTATIDGSGSYVLSGERGTGLFVLLDINAGGLGVMDALGPSLATLDFDSLVFDSGGRFSLLLSAERPADWAADWHRLDPAARTLSLRQASYDWGQDREARIAIERIDKVHAPRRLAPDEIRSRLLALSGYPQRLAGMALGFIKAQRDKGLWNRLEHDDWAGRGGVPGQHYYQGLFRLGAGEALVIETELPERVRYWNIQLSDMLWNSIEWVNRQSSLNGGQARIDGDGRFRAVIAREDPGVPNWLDPGGWDQGAIMLRWTEASCGPEPRLAVVPIDKLRDLLPAETPHVSPAEREAQLRARRRAVQWRRRW